MLDQNTLSTVKLVMNKYVDDSKYKVFIFGSRVQPKHRKFSDLDIGIIGSTRLPISILLQIKEDLSNSDIPYLTDVVDFSTVSENFRREALSKIIPL